MDDALPTPSQGDHHDHSDDCSSDGAENGTVLTAYGRTSDRAGGEKDNREKATYCEDVR